MPKDKKDIRIITISGRIASGSTTLAKNLAKELNWKHIEGGDIFWERVRGKLGLDPKDTHKRPDREDEIFDAELKKIIKQESKIVLETKLAGFNAQGVDGIFKVLVICEDDEKADHADIRIDRLVNREKIDVKAAKAEVIEREQNDLEKWRRLYAGGDKKWVYWDPKYYDLVVNTYFNDAEASLKMVLKGLKKYRS